MAKTTEIPFLHTELIKSRVNIAGRHRAPKFRIELVREGSLSVPDKKLSSPTAVYALAKDLVGGLDREAFYIITLNQKNNVIGVNLVSMGSLSAAIVHPREVYKMAVLQNAASIIAFHNHPSGDTEPSKEDIQITRKLVEAGEVLGITFLDHIVVGEGRFLSMFETFPEMRSKG